jgi:hypothetical protein
MSQAGKQRLHRGWAACLALLALLVLRVPLVSGQAQAQASAELVHGADSLFVTPDVAIVWAVLKQPAGDNATVWLRIVNRKRKFSHVSVDGVDPFSNKRVAIEPGRALADEVALPSDRDTFSTSPAREVHFYRTESDWRAARPLLTIYYLGVPDTTPEFATRAAMDRYLSTVRLAAGAGQARP